MLHLPALVASAIAVGTLAGVWSPSVGLPALFLAVAASGLAVAAAGRSRPGRFLVATLMAATALAAARASWTFAAAATPTLVAALDRAGVLADDRPRPRESVVLTGLLLRDAAIEGPSVLLRLGVTHLGLGACACPMPVHGTALVAVAGAVAPSQRAQWTAGRTVTLTATVRRPVSYRNPRAPDATHDLVRRRLAITASVKSALLVEVTRGSWPHEWAASVRARARAAIARAAGDDADAAAIGTAVLVGDRAGLDAELTARLQRAGTFHVVAISGGNIALLAGVALWTLHRLVGAGRLALALTGGLLIAYAFVVGGGASVLRATGMAVVGLAARSLDQRGAALNILALTGAVLLVADPLLAVDTGFWLTTAATAGLIVGLGDAPAGVPRWRRLGRALVLTSVWAELGLLPIVASAFQQVTVAGVALSALAIPGMALAQVAAMAAVVADVCAAWLMPVAGAGLRAGAWVVTESARVADLLPVLTWRVPSPHAAAVVAYYVALVWWLWARVPGGGAARARQRPPALAALAMAAIWVAAAPPSLLTARGALEIVFLDVGQGDAMAIRFPNGRTMLVDAGGRPAAATFDVGSRVVGPALRALGIRWLDYVVVTHADADHIGGAAAIVHEFGPAEVWTGVPVAGDAATAALRQAADSAGASWRILQRGDRLAIGGVEIVVLHPPPPEWERQRVRNDDSVVLVMQHAGLRVLLTGDVGATVDRELAAAVEASSAAGAAGLTVLKLAHHGSAGSTSTAFLEDVRPAAAVVSVGRDNPFGHPAPAAVDRLTATHVDVWRTDRDGAITLRSDGRSVALSSISGRRRRWPARLPP